MAAWALFRLIGLDNTAAAQAAVRGGAADVLAAAVLDAPAPADIHGSDAVAVAAAITALRHFGDCSSALGMILSAAPQAVPAPTAARIAMAATRALGRALAAWPCIVRGSDANPDATSDAALWVARPVLLLALLASSTRWGAAKYSAIMDAARTCGAAELLSQTEARLKALLRQRRAQPHDGAEDHDTRDEVAVTIEDVIRLQAAFLRRCSRCGATDAEAGPLRRCAGCREVAYCSPRCQAADWAEHKAACTAAQQHAAAAGTTTAER
jgi:hypothetical protein